VAMEVLSFYLEDFDLENLPPASDINALEILENTLNSIVAIDILKHKKVVANKLSERHFLSQNGSMKSHSKKMLTSRKS